jgi:hypothetical protein
LAVQVPTVVKPVELWTGKQVISVLIRPNAECPIFVNLELKEKTYTSQLHLCPADGFVCIRNSELVSGRIGKGLLGGAKRGLFGTLAARYSPAAAGALLPHRCRHAALPLMVRPHSAASVQCAAAASAARPFAMPLPVFMHRHARPERAPPHHADVLDAVPDVQASAWRGWPS